MPQNQREWLRQSPLPAASASAERRVVSTERPHSTGVESMSSRSSAAPRASLREDVDQPLDRLGQGASAFVVAGLAGKAWEQVTQLAPGCGEKAPVTGLAHDRLGDAQGDHLGVGDHLSGVRRGAGQRNQSSRPVAPPAPA